MSMALAGAAPAAPIELWDQVEVEGPDVTLGEVADLSVLPASIRSEAEAIRIAQMHGPQQSVSASAIGSRARSALPALAPWFCDVQKKNISLYRSDTPLGEGETVFRRGQPLILTVTVGRVGVERDVWALQDGRGSGAIFVRTADGDVLRAEGSELR